MLYIRTLVSFLASNMKYYFDGIIIVEGTGDSSFLSSFIDALYVETNGYDLKEKEIDFVNNSNKPIIVLTDSDKAGKQIRQTLLSKIPSAISLEVDLGHCNKNNKHGVAECDREEVINTLNSYLTTSKREVGNIKNRDLIRIGINNKEIREYVCQELHLGICNQKEIIKRIDFLKIDFSEIERVVNKFYGN